MSFQVSRHKVDPLPASRAFNLLPNDAVRATLADEPVEGGPKVPLVSKPAAFACRAERLAWAGSGPERMIGGDSRLSQGKRPSAEAGEKVALSKSNKLVWRNVFNAPFVHYARRNFSRLNQVAQPRRAIGVYFVVEIHAEALFCANPLLWAGGSPNTSAVIISTSMRAIGFARASLARLKWHRPL